jgi:hypothetical protein
MCTCSFRITLTSLSIRWTSQQSVRSCWMTRILSWNSLRYAVWCFFCKFLYCCWLCWCFFFVLPAFIWSFGLTKSFLPPSLLSGFLVHFTRITMSLFLLFSSYNHNIPLPFQVNPVYNELLFRYCSCIAIVTPIWWTWYCLLVLLIERASFCFLSFDAPERNSWATWDAICLLGADLGKKMTGGTLNMITKLALYLVVCEGLVIHLCGGTHHGEKLSCTTTSNFWVANCALTQHHLGLPLYHNVYFLYSFLFLLGTKVGSYHLS